MKNYEVIAIKWDGGWELHVTDEGVTQVRTLDKAVSQVRDYLATLHGRDFSKSDVHVSLDLGGLEQEILATRDEISAAAEAQRLAGEHSRKLARDLRAKGLSVSDTASAIGVSRGRVSQLLA